MPFKIGLYGYLRSIGKAAAMMLALSASLAQAQQPPEYKLHAGDLLEISVWKEVDLQSKLQVRPDGRFSFPLTGEILAEGKTVAEVQTEITTRLKKYIPEPVVTVSVSGIEGNKVYVIGQVNKPGAIVMNPQVTVLQALSVAGGTTPYASVNDIIIVRSADGTQRVLPFRYSDVSRGRNLDQNIKLESGDVVVVP